MIKRLLRHLTSLVNTLKRKSYDLYDLRDYWIFCDYNNTLKRNKVGGPNIKVGDILDIPYGRRGVAKVRVIETTQNSVRYEMLEVHILNKYF